MNFDRMPAVADPACGRRDFPDGDPLPASEDLRPGKASKTAKKFRRFVPFIRHLVKTAFLSRIYCKVLLPIKITANHRKHQQISIDNAWRLGLGFLAWIT